MDTKQMVLDGMEDEVLTEVAQEPTKRQAPQAMVRIWLSPGEEVRFITGRSKAIAFVQTLRTIGFNYARYELNWTGFKCRPEDMPVEAYKRSIKAAFAKYHRLVERHLAAQTA